MGRLGQGGTSLQKTQALMERLAMGGTTTWSLLQE
jgi:hypothetical protein